MRKVNELLVKVTGLVLCGVCVWGIIFVVLGCVRLAAMYGAR